jgi:hypothetical protein
MVTNKAKMVTINSNSKPMLSNAEREKLVLDLYNQGKNLRQIAKEARMSFRDIGPIIRKHQPGNGTAENNNHQSSDNVDDVKQGLSSSGPKDKDTRAYKLFSQGKKPVEVAVDLGLNGEETIRLYEEFWRLKHLNGLYKIYPEIKHTLPSFLKLHKSLKRQGMGPKNVEYFVEILKSGTYDIPALEIQIEYAKSDLEAMQYKKNKYIDQVNELNDRVAYLQSVEQSLIESCNGLRQNIQYLENEQERLETFTETYKRTDKKYCKIKKIARGYINSFLTDRRILVSAAVIAVIEALKMNPDKHQMICNNDSAMSNESYSTLPELHTSTYDEYSNHKIVLDTAHALYNRLVKWFGEKTLDSAIAEV